MLERLRPHWPRIKRWAFYGSAVFLFVYYGLLSHDELPPTVEHFDFISDQEYAEMLRRDTDDTLLVDIRTEYAQKDVHANALLGDMDYEEMGRHLAERSEELKDKNLVFL